MPNLTLPKGPRVAKGLRALADLVEGQQLSKTEHAAAEYAHGKLVDLLGPVWAQALPADRLGKMVGKQSSQLNTFAAVGITSVKGKPLDLFDVVHEAFALIDEHRKVIDWERAGGDIDDTLSELDRVTAEVNRLGQIVADFRSAPAYEAEDEEDGGNLDRAKLRKLRADAACSELKLREKAAELVRADEVVPLLTVVADRIRAAGDAIGQQYGGDAQRIITGALDEAERRLAELRQQQRTIDTSSPADAA